MQPMNGIVVLDLTVMTAGPVGTMMLGDLGADVIKIEEIAKGDLSRNIGNAFVGNESANYLSANRNKRSVRIDLKSDAGRMLFLSLAKKADVICENFRPGTVDKLGVGYDKIREINENIIYASVSAFGQTGPYVNRPANDAIIQAVSGGMAATGDSGGEPMRFGFPSPDFGAAALLAYGISAALFHRERTGVGQKIEISLLDGFLFSSIPREGETLLSGVSPRRQGSLHPRIAPYRNYMGSEGEYFFLSCFTERFWERLCAALERPDLVNDSRFHDNPTRVENENLLSKILQNIFRRESCEYWVERLSDFGVPAAKVQDLNFALRHDPQVKHNEMLTRLPHPTVGVIESLSHPVKFMRTPAEYRRPPPTFGQHTFEILEGLGISQNEYDKYLSLGVVRGQE